MKEELKNRFQISFSRKIPERKINQNKRRKKKRFLKEQKKYNQIKIIRKRPLESRIEKR